MTARAALSAGLAAAGVALAAPAPAHDFWLQPDRFVAPPAQPLAVWAWIGHPAAPEAFPRDPRHAESFALVGPGATRGLPGRPGRTPADWALPDGAGVFAIAYQSSDNDLVLEAPAFQDYLRDAGLEAALAERLAAGEAGEPGRERYLRCAKALLRVGAARSDGFDRRVGLPLEIVPASDPFAMGSSGALAFRVLLRGEPLAGARLRARALAATAGHPEHLARTDAAGRAILPLAPDLPWLLTAVHMERARGEPGIDWRSLWASLALEPTRATERTSR